MEEAAFQTAVAAVGLGIFAQILAHRYRLPALVLLLVFGVAFGPDVLGLLNPAALEHGLPLLVKLAVAIILFEGALALRLGELKAALFEVRQLVTWGVLVTWLGAALAGHFLARLSPGTAVLFGALVSVTGPTVIQPLLKRIPVPRRLKTILEGEAILVDPVGALLAVVVFEALIGFGHGGLFTLPEALAGYLGRFLVGGLVGAFFGAGLSWLLKQPRWVPLELKNLVALAAVLVAFGVADLLLSEAGIVAAVVMGLAVQRGAIPEEHRLRRFKEQLTTLAISLLFVLLAANLPLKTVLAEGMAGLWTVLALILVVRPLAVFLTLQRSPLELREKLFIAAVGPRGIVAASVASLFALGLPGEGTRLLALVFLTIFLTVLFSSLLAPFLARGLGLAEAQHRLALIVGAGGLGRRVARILLEAGRPVSLVDRNPRLVREALREKLPILRGNALDEDVLEAAGADEAATLLAVTQNPEVNLLTVLLGREVFAIERAYPAVDAESIKLDLVKQAGGQVAFGRAIDLPEWDHALAHGEASIVEWTVPKGFAEKAVEALDLPPELLPLVRFKGKAPEVVHAAQTWAAGERIVFASRLAPEEAKAVLLRLSPPSS